MNVTIGTMHRRQDTDEFVGHVHADVLVENGPPNLEHSDKILSNQKVLRQFDSGFAHVVISDRFVTHARESGLRIREYAPRAGEGIQCTVAADDDLLVARLAVDLTVASRVDLSWCDRRGVEQQRMADIPIRPDAGTVILQQSIAWAKASPSATMIARLLAVDDNGSERLLGEYTFHHTRTIPGPPGWELP